MEPIIALAVLAAFIALGPLAARFGYDSRDGSPSQEERLAAHGMTWNERRHQEQLAAEIAAARPALPPAFPAEAHRQPVLA